MIDTTKSAPAIRELAFAETEAVSGGLGFPTATLERLELQRKLSDAYKAHHEEELGKKIRDRLEASLGH
jgi:hypothetical protein